MYYPSLEEVKSYRKEGNAVPIYREIVADLETPVSAFLKIKSGSGSFLLESVEGGQRLARYSFIGTEPYRTIATKSGDSTGPLEQIAAELSKKKIVQVGDLPRFCGGAVGYLGYETIKRFEDVPSPEPDPLGLPESFFMFVDTMLVFDHVKHTIKVLSYVDLDGDIEEEYRKATAKIDGLIERLGEPLKPADAGDIQVEQQHDHRITSNFSRKEFGAAVNAIKQYITEGEAIQVVLSQRMAKRTDIEPFEIYRALRSINPSPYMFFLDYGDFQIVGASPEVLVRVEDGMVMTRPLAGTRPRGANREDDEALEQELRHDEKERAEHIMLVDLGRNDIGRVSEPGTVKVSELMEVERYSHVMHLVTHVEGKLRKELTVFDALSACFPAGTVSGAPKIRAMEIIAGLEPEKRGPYAGAVGYFSFSDNMDMAIAIRTMVVKDGTAYVQAGCGIVYDSVPEKEYQETLNKAMAQLKAIDRAEQRKITRSGDYALID